ncbi:MAG: NAD(P)-dependent oxidoreductase [Verrucomicrobia bacterium]|nr:MAG: NAD(P)-dependent oxidoreductase [Verrucomicrobiota bacterium]
MKVAITGASGYVGGAIAECFRGHGHEVLALSRRPCAAPWHTYALGDDPQQLPWDGVDVLVHAAYDFSGRSWQEILEMNVKPSMALLQAARQAGVGHLVFISSMSSFDGCRSNYGKAKLLVEKAALALGAVVIRPGLVWSNSSGGVMETLEKLVTKLPVVPFLIGGEHLKQYLIHEADLSESVAALAENWPSSTLHSVTHPTPVSLLQILRAIAKRAKRRRIYLPIPWPCAMAGLKCLEMLGIRCSFRSDSLVGLVHGNPHPAVTTPPDGVCYRPFV